MATKITGSDVTVGGKSLKVKSESLTLTTSASGNADIATNATNYDPTKHIIVGISASGPNNEAYIAIPYVYNVHSTVIGQLRGVHIARDGATMAAVESSTVIVNIYYIDK